MKLLEVAVEYHKDLCPKFWDGMVMKDEVREKLLEIAESFIEYLDTSFDPDDITVTGSAANYNWTKDSDIDLHLITDVDDYKKVCPDYAEDFFNDKKSLWNEHHEIEIFGHPVEVYVQDSKEEHKSSGVYSILNGEWTVKPKYDPPKDVDEQEIEFHTNRFVTKIDELTKEPGNGAQADKVKEEIRIYRKMGLDSKEKEFSVPNLVFKSLRHSGHMGKLVDYIRDDKSEELSL